MMINIIDILYEFPFSGLIRLVKFLSQDHVFGKEQEINFVVDAGTGTTAIGLALGALYLGFVPYSTAFSFLKHY